MPTEPQPLSLAAAARRAVEACDPSGRDADLGDFLARLEDHDEPITAVQDVEAPLDEAVRSVDPEDDNPGVRMAAAVTAYLAHRRDEAGEDRERLLSLAARSEFEGGPPEPVRDWLEAAGVSAS